MSALTKHVQKYKYFLIALILFAGYIVFKNWSIRRSSIPGVSNPQSINRISWEDAKEKINNCEIGKIVENDSMQASLISTDNIAYSVFEPEKGAATEVYDSVRSKCTILSGNK